MSTALPLANAQTPAHATTKPLPLVVDLDGTLCKTDTLWECFFAAWRQQWWLPFTVIFWLLSGRSVLKARLAERALPDVAVLPWNVAVLAKIQAQRTAGGRIILATAANERVANACAAQLGVFDEVMASDATTNLKANAKADALVAKFGRNGFDYIGDSRADISVWAQAARKFSTSALLPDGVVALENSHASSGAFSRWFRLLRARHWVKNVLVFVAPIAAHQWSAAGAWQATALTFAAFCCVCSGVYVFNDLFDLASDRAHPSKRLRPLAAGELPLSSALCVAIILLLGGLALALAAGPAVAVVVSIYVVVNAFYTTVLKRIPVFDVFCLAGLYTLRIAAGGAAVSVPISTWLVAFSVFAFLSLALLKRSADLVRLAPDELLPGRGYSGRDATFVSTFGVASAIAACLVLALYVSSDQVASLYREPLALWGVVIVILLWLARVWRMAMSGNMDDDPVLFATRDAVSIGCAISVVLCVGIAV